jgi:drug/metabolite transporter (DMT)-like permease
MSSAWSGTPVTPAVWGLFVLAMALDVLGQTAFKSGLGRIPGSSTRARFWSSVALSPFILAGVAGYAVEACAWMYVLGHAPMSVVGPMATLSYVGAVFAGSFLLHERVGTVRLAGATLVTVGAALLASTTR